MSFNNYNPYQGYPMQMGYPVQAKPFEFDTMLYFGLGITVAVLIVWFVWATDYRYSSDRISNRMISKYNKPVRDDQTILADNGKLSADKRTAQAVITIRDKGIDSISTQQEVYSLPVRDNCSPMDKSCLSL